MTELYEYYRDKGYKALCDKVHDLSDSLLMAELDDTVQLDLVGMDSWDWAKDTKKKVYSAISSEMHDRMKSRSKKLEYLEGEQEEEKMKRQARAQALIEVIRITEGLDLEGLVDRYARIDYDKSHIGDDVLHFEYLTAMQKYIEERITAITLERHGYKHQEIDNGNYSWMKK